MPRSTQWSNALECDVQVVFDKNDMDRCPYLRLEQHLLACGSSILMYTQKWNRDPCRLSVNVFVGSSGDQEHVGRLHCTNMAQALSISLAPSFSHKLQELWDACTCLALSLAWHTLRGLLWLVKRAAGAQAQKGARSMVPLPFRILIIRWEAKNERAQHPPGWAVQIVDGSALFRKAVVI
eukprot:scaffold108544_cov18-Tisochrysis_lutea.AAC.1